MSQPSTVKGSGDRPCSRTDRHFVVIKNNEKLFAELAGVVKGFIGDAGGKRAVTEHNYRVSIGLSLKVIPDFEANAASDAAAGVAGHEKVIRAFGRVGIAHQAAFGADGVKLLVTARN